MADQLEPVKVTRAVGEAIKALNDSHLVSMHDRQKVMVVLTRYGLEDAAIWVQQHPQEYEQLLRCGFIITD